MQHAKREWNIKSLGELRSAVTSIFLQKQKPPREEIATIKEYKDMHSQGESPGDDKNEK